MIFFMFRSSDPIRLIDWNGKLMIDLGFANWFLTLLFSSKPVFEQMLASFQLDHGE